MIHLFTLGIFTEDKIGLLNRTTGIFTRRNISIESLTVSETEITGVFRFNIKIKTTFEQVEKVKNQIEKLIEVIRVQVYEEHETIYQEIALYKVPTVRLLESDSIEKLIRKHAARILYVGPEFLVIEKTGHKEETQSLFQDLEEFGIIEFVRSGRIFVSKSTENLISYLSKNLESNTTLLQN
jgi:acetolactate synthase-1/3 small subunit